MSCFSATALVFIVCDLGFESVAGSEKKGGK